MDYRKEYVVKPGGKVDLPKFDTGKTKGVKDKSQGKEILRENCKRLDELQYLLYAENKRSLLVVLQAMDAGGKDGTIRHVFGPINPQGCKVTSFKAPTAQELEHDFLWRIHRHTPRKGEIAVFNRSHYEDVLVVSVHNLVPEKVWSKRFEQINCFERTLSQQNVHILKFFLHISKDEQLERFRARVENENKHWKISPADFEQRKYWDDYMLAFERVLNKCSTEQAPWYIVPADHKWYRNVVVSSILLETLEGLDMKFPEPACDVSKIKLE